MCGSFIECVEVLLNILPNQIVKRGFKKEKEGSTKTRLAGVMMAYRVLPQSTTGESLALLLQKCLLKPGQNERHMEHWHQKQKAEHDAHRLDRLHSHKEKLCTLVTSALDQHGYLVSVKKFQVQSHIWQSPSGKKISLRPHRCRLTSADGEQSTETSQQVPEVLEELVPVASNEASTSSLAVPLEDSATSSHQDSPAEDTSSPGITETSIVEQSSVTDSTAEGLYESIVTGNSVPSIQNSRIVKAYPRRVRHPPD